MFNLTVDEVKELSKKYNMIPLTIECYADMDTPISVFKRYNNSRCKRSRQINIVSEYERNFKATFGDSKIYG